MRRLIRRIRWRVYLLRETPLQRQIRLDIAREMEAEFERRVITGDGWNVQPRGLLGGEL